ncbi:MAG: DUF1512 family protein [Candidatus Bathyarchaeia archaeon]
MAVGAGEGDAIGNILTLIWYLSFFFFLIYGQKIQTWMMLREIGGAVNRLKVFRDDARRMAIKAVKEVGKEEDPTPRIDHFMEYFTTLPASLDPAGLVPKIDHVIDVRDQRFRDEVALIAPQADGVVISNLTGVMEVALGLNFIYRIVRHFYLLGKKTMSLYVIMQIQMQLPIIMQLAEAYFGAVKAFANGQPIGDGAGALVAAKLMYGKAKRKIAKDIVASEVPIDGRRVFVIKAEGPGANIGKPGDGIQRLIEECNGEVSMVVMVDAASKFEGEKSGETAEGIGTAIGGIGVDQFKIEETVTSHMIPVNAVIIKESLKDAVAPMKKEIYEGVEVALARVKRLIHERTKEGSTVIVAGVGNTVGIGQ